MLVKWLWDTSERFLSLCAGEDHPAYVKRP